MGKSATHSASKKSAGGSISVRRSGKIHITPASASAIRATLGITPAEMRVADKAIAAAKKSDSSTARVTVARKSKPVHKSAVKRTNDR